MYMHNMIFGAGYLQIIKPLQKLFDLAKPNHIPIFMFGFLPADFSVVKSEIM